MAPTTKYQRAPQEDPEDYTQAPPAYAEGSSSRTDEQTGLFGAPRSSEDNLPDDFKVRLSAITRLGSRFVPAFHATSCTIVPRL